MNSQNYSAKQAVFTKWAILIGLVISVAAAILFANIATAQEAEIDQVPEEIPQFENEQDLSPKEDVPADPEKVITQPQPEPSSTPQVLGVSTQPAETSLK